MRKNEIMRDSKTIMTQSYSDIEEKAAIKENVIMKLKTNLKNEILLAE